MQKILYYCDKCKKEIKTGRVRMEFISVAMDSTTGSFDLHPKCRDELISLLRAPVQEEEEEEAPARTKIDRGKVMALHDAGWKTKDIAGEMHLKDRQVSQVIYQERKKRENG